MRTPHDLYYDEDLHAMQVDPGVDAYASQWGGPIRWEDAPSDSPWKQACRAFSKIIDTGFGSTMMYDHGTWLVTTADGKHRRLDGSLVGTHARELAVLLARDAIGLDTLGRMDEVRQHVRQ